MSTIPVPVPPPRSVGGGSSAHTISSTEPVFYTVDGEQGLDLNLSVSDLFIEFGDATLDETTFDPADCLYYPVTNAFGVEPMGPPVDATKIAVMGVQPGARLARKSALFPKYGGNPYTFHYADRALPALYSQLLLRAVNYTTGVTMIWAGKPNPEATAMFAMALFSAASGDATPRLQIQSGAADTWNGLVADDAGTGTKSSGTVASTAEWTLVRVTLKTDRTVATRVWKESTGWNAEQVSAAQATAIADFTYCGFGASSAGASGFEGQTWAGMVVDGEITADEEERLPTTAPRWWKLLLDDPSKCVGYWPILSLSPLMDMCTGRLLTFRNTGGASNAANMTQSAPTGTPYWTLRRLNRIESTTSASDVVYSNVASGDNTLAVCDSGVWRYENPSIVRYDVGTAPNPATQFAVTAAGTGLLCSPGGTPGKIDIINDSGSASDTSMLNLVPLGYHPTTPIPWEQIDDGELANIEMATVLDAGGQQWATVTEDVSADFPGKWRIWAWRMDPETGLPLTDDGVREVDIGLVNVPDTSQWGYYGASRTPFIAFIDTNYYISYASPTGSGATFSATVTLNGANDPLAADATGRSYRSSIYGGRSSSDLAPVFIWFDWKRPVTTASWTRLRAMRADNAARHLIVVDESAFSNYGRADPTLTNNPFATVNGSAVITVTDSVSSGGHLLKTGQYISYSGASAVAGLTLNGVQGPITNIDGTHYSFVASGNANATTSGGGAAVVANYGAHAQGAMAIGFHKALENDRQAFTQGFFHSPAANASCRNQIFDYSAVNWATDTVDTAGGWTQTDCFSTDTFSMVDNNNFWIGTPGSGATHYFTSGHGIDGAIAATGHTKTYIHSSTGDKAADGGSYTAGLDMLNPEGVSAIMGVSALAQSVEVLQYNYTEFAKTFEIWWNGDLSTLAAGATQGTTPFFNGQTILGQPSTGLTMRLTPADVVESGAAIMETEVMVLANGVGIAYTHSRAVPTNGVITGQLYYQRLGTYDQLVSILTAAAAEAAAA